VGADGRKGRKERKGERKDEMDYEKEQGCVAKEKDANWEGELEKRKDERESFENTRIIG
jgi:hypothetical protein